MEMSSDCSDLKLPNSTIRGNMFEEEGFSYLLDEIIERIMYYLSARDAAMTSILCKKWNRVWGLLPDLDFDFAKSKFYPIVEDELMFQENLSIIPCMDAFANHVDEIITRLTTRENSMILIRRFSLSIPWPYHAPSNITLFMDHWIGALIPCRVMELNLDLGHKVCIFTNSVFQLQSLISLSLVGLRIEEKISPENASLPFLKVLRLDRVNVLRDVIERIIHGCPSLQRLSVCSLGCDFIRLINLPALKQLQVSKVRTYIDCLENLEILEYIYYHDWANVKISRCKRVKEFTIKCCHISESVLEAILLEVPVMEKISLTCSLLPKVEILNPEVRSVTLFNSDCRHHNIICIHSFHLTFFAYNGYYPVPSVDIANIAAVQTSQLELYMFDPSQNWFLSLRNYLWKFGKHDLVHIHVISSSCMKKIAAERTIDANLIPPIIVVKHVLIQSWLEQEEWDCRCLLDALLWTCRPHCISLKLMEPYGPINSKLEEFVIFFQCKLAEGVDKEGCRLIEVNCSYHDMADKCDWGKENPPSLEMFRLTTTMTNVDKIHFGFIPPPPCVFHFTLKWMSRVEG